MVEIYLLQFYQGSARQSIIKVSKSDAQSLVEQGIARYAKTRDYLVKPIFGKSKGFDKAPKVA